MAAAGFEMESQTMEQKTQKKVEIKKALKKNLALEIKTLEVRAAPAKMMEAFARGKGGY